MNGRIKRPGQTTGLTIPRLGLIKIGIKNEKGYPQSVDYFVCSSEKYGELFKEAYGEKPKSLLIMFLSDDPKDSCNEEYQLRDDAGRVVASGDGEIFKVWSAGSKKYEEYSVKEYPQIMDTILSKFPSKKGWEVTLTLRFMLPKLNSVIGYWQLTTKGNNSSIPQIREMFDFMLEKERSGVGRVKGVPIDMNVTFAKSQKPGDSSRYPVISIVPNISDNSINILKKAMVKNEDNIKQLTDGTNS